MEERTFRITESLLQSALTVIGAAIHPRYSHNDIAILQQSLSKCEEIKKEEVNINGDNTPSQE